MKRRFLEFELLTYSKTIKYMTIAPNTYDYHVTHLYVVLKIGGDNDFEPRRFGSASLSQYK